MKITLPEGFPMPEGARPGESFEVVATIAPDEEGGFTLAALDGMPMTEEGEAPAPEEEEMEEEEPEDEVTEYNDASKITLPF